MSTMVEMNLHNWSKQTPYDRAEAVGSFCALLLARNADV